MLSLHRSQIVIDDAFKMFLPPRARLRINSVLLYVIGDLFEPQLALNHPPGQLRIPSLISAFERQLESPILDHLACNEKSPCAGIHAAHMSLQQILRIDGLPPDLGIEIETSGSETAGLNDLAKSQNEFRHVHRELVGIPAEQ